MQFKKIWISETAYKIRQYRDDVTERWVDEDHLGYLRWLSAGNVPEEVAYVPPVVPADDDPAILTQAKRDKIWAIRSMFMELVKDTYDPVEISIRNMRAIDNLSQSRSVGVKFSNMVSDLGPCITWRTNLIQAVKACTLVSQVESIVVAYP